MPTINFFTEEINFKLSNKRLIKKWIEQSINQESYHLVNINYIFCSDQYLLNINQQYLNHDTYTDIITFDNSENKFDVEAEIFISIDRIIFNANKFNTTVDEELYRVMIHGVLHLCGYNDKNEKEKINMKEKENQYVKMLHTLKT
jgi:rRNA maturation RNase YbeY